MVMVKPIPPRHRRKLIIQGDEAKVSRIWTSDHHNGLVERIQPIGMRINNDGRLIPAHSFHIQRDTHFASSETPLDIFYAYEERYILLKFLALKFAGAVFPEHFVQSQSLFLCEGNGISYSTFVPDETGVLERQKKIRARFSDPNGFDNKLVLVVEFDKNENRINPHLEELETRIHNAGIIIPHPEMNYHVAGGKIVFFEVAGIALLEALETAKKNTETNPRAFRRFVHLFAHIVNELPYSLLHSNLYREHETNGKRVSIAKLAYMLLDKIMEERSENILDELATKND